MGCAEVTVWVVHLCANLAAFLQAQHQSADVRSPHTKTSNTVAETIGAVATGWTTTAANAVKKIGVAYVRSRCRIGDYTGEALDNGSRQDVLHHHRKHNEHGSSHVHRRHRFGRERWSPSQPSITKDKRRIGGATRRWRTSRLADVSVALRDAQGTRDVEATSTGRPCWRSRVTRCSHEFALASDSPVVFGRRRAEAIFCPVPRRRSSAPSTVPATTTSRLAHGPIGGRFLLSGDALDSAKGDIPERGCEYLTVGLRSV